MENNFVTVTNYPDVMSANICKSHLEAEGIQCMLENEGLVARNPELSVAYGGIKVKVREKDAKRALEIIDGK